MIKALEDWLGITSLKETVDFQEAQLNELRDSNLRHAANYAALVSDYNSLYKTNLSGQGQLASCNTTITESEKHVKELMAQINTGAYRDIFLKPVPALLVEEPNPKKVVMGDFAITTSQGVQTLSYPAPSAVFMPCPMFEFALTLADCNRPRPDLTEFQICKKLANTAQIYCTYLADDRQWNRMDNRTPAVIAILLRRDDCETLAEVICSLIHYHEIKFGAFKTISVCEGEGHLYYGGNSYGHAFVLVLSHMSSELKDNFIIEATDNYASEPLALDKYGENYDCDWGVIGFPRKGFEQGTYQIKEKWWAPLGTMDAINPSLVSVLKDLIISAPKPSKEDALKKFAEERRNDKNGSF